MPRSAIIKKYVAVVLMGVLTLSFTACSAILPISKMSPSASASGITPHIFGTTSAQASASETAPPPTLSLSSSQQTSNTQSTLTYDKNTVIKNAKAVISLANSGNFTKLFGMLRDDVQKLSSADDLKDSVDKVLSSAGKFVSYKNTKTGTASDKQYGTYVAAEITAQHQNMELIYTVAFDKDMKMIGFYVKEGGTVTMKYDKTTVTKNAESVISTLNSGDYTSVYNLLRDDIKKMFSLDAIKASFSPILSGAGKFIEFKDTTTEVQANSTYGTYVSVRIIAHYTSKDLTYVVDIDQNMKLVGLSVS